MIRTDLTETPARATAQETRVAEIADLVSLTTTRNGVTVDVFPTSAAVARAVYKATAPLAVSNAPGVSRFPIAGDRDFCDAVWTWAEGY